MSNKTKKKTTFGCAFDMPITTVAVFSGEGEHSSCDYLKNIESIQTTYENQMWDTVLTGVLKMNYGEVVQFGAGSFDTLPWEYHEGKGHMWIIAHQNQHEMCKQFSNIKLLRVESIMTPNQQIKEVAYLQASNCAATWTAKKNRNYVMRNKTAEEINAGLKRFSALLSPLPKWHKPITRKEVEEAMAEKLADIRRRGRVPMELLRRRVD